MLLFDPLQGLSKKTNVLNPLSKFVLFFVFVCRGLNLLFKLTFGPTIRHAIACRIVEPKLKVGWLCLRAPARRQAVDSRRPASHVLPRSLSLWRRDPLIPWRERTYANNDIYDFTIYEFYDFTILTIIYDHLRFYDYLLLFTIIYRYLYLFTITLKVITLARKTIGGNNFGGNNYWWE